VSPYEWVMVVCAIIWTLLAIGALVAIFFLLGFARRQVTDLTRKADAVLDEARRLVHSTTEAAEYVAGRARSIADKAETVADETRQTVDKVARQIVATTTVIRDAVSEPVVGAASVLAGVRKGIQAWLKGRKSRPAGSGQE
jgi:predicted PurR-regulated permease PerM